MKSAVISERRIGRREGVEPVRVEWWLDRPETPAERVRRRIRAKALPHAVLLDISVTGAQVLAPAERKLRVGSRLVIKVKGVSGTVVVRRIVRCSNPDLCLYGLEVARHSPDLGDLIARSLSSPLRRPELVAVPGRLI
ncbi:MAG: hypothetical protein JWM05_3751 [Acidimicrobiales bacterium]|nr:hypothetical protein [Acidimicrobiales bacterium]